MRTSSRDWSMMGFVLFLVFDLIHRPAHPRLWFVRDYLLIVEHFFQLRIVRMAGSDGFLVMPLSQFDEGWLLSQVNDGEIVMGAGVVGFKLDRFAEGSLGCAAHAF